MKTKDKVHEIYAGLVGLVVGDCMGEVLVTSRISSFSRVRIWLVCARVGAWPT